MGPTRVISLPAVPFLMLALASAGCGTVETTLTAPGHAAGDTTWIEAAAKDHLRAGQERYGIRDVDDFGLERAFVGSLGRGHAHLQQVVSGVPVFEGQAIVHFHADGRFAGITNDLHADVMVDTTPSMGADQAIGKSCARLSQPTPRRSSWSKVTLPPTRIQP